jgi:ribosomal protein S18 acetylase RimI-like enzyme
MVHPRRRREGIGAALLDRALAFCAARSRTSALVICEDAMPVAGDWMGRRGGTHDSTELRMVLDLTATPPPVATPAGEPLLTLRQASGNDRRVLVDLLSGGFEGFDRTLLEEMIRRGEDAGDESLIAWEGDQPVGTLRLVDIPRRAMVYGLVIRTALRGRGYGTATMRSALAILRGRGAPQVSLEVEPDNSPAVRLYQGFGFRTVTTYRYWRVPAGQPTVD